MCRFVVYTGEKAALAPLMYGGSHSLHDQSYKAKELLNGLLNADGYAVAWYHEGQPVRIADTKPIWQNGDLERTLGTIRSTMAVAAVRNATPGMPYGLSAVSPLILDRWAFSLNGYMQDFRPRFMREFRLDLPDRLYGELRGTTDTETLFLMALAQVERGLSLSDALGSVARTAIEAANREGLEAQLNMVFTDGESVVITRTSSHEQSNSLYVAESSTLMASGTLVASEPLGEAAAWNRVEHNHMVYITADSVVSMSHMM